MSPAFLLAIAGGEQRGKWEESPGKPVSSASEASRPVGKEREGWNIVFWLADFSGAAWITG